MDFSRLLVAQFESARRWQIDCKEHNLVVHIDIFKEIYNTVKLLENRAIDINNK